MPHKRYILIVMAKSIHADARLSEWIVLITITRFFVWRLAPDDVKYAYAALVSTCLFVCFITKSFLTDSFVLPTPTLSTICRPLSSYTCSITPETVNVGSSYSHMRGPGVGCWLSDRSNCSHWSFEAAVLPINPNIYADQWEPIVIYHSITLTGRYTTMQPTLLTSWLQLLSTTNDAGPTSIKYGSKMCLV